MHHKVTRRGIHPPPSPNASNINLWNSYSKDSSLFWSAGERNFVSGTRPPFDRQHVWDFDFVLRRTPTGRSYKNKKPKEGTRRGA